MKRFGFTLIELLVVIAVIAVLMGILMPALNRARDQGRKIVCSNNLHSLAIANGVYASTFNDWNVPCQDAHNGQANFAFYDGHVASMHKEKVWVPEAFNSEPYKPRVNSVLILPCSSI